jgi:tetratricopeptide (TPR) repeat protein
LQTLYELLGALPDDDADRLRAAFRNAAKASHPDNNLGDPDAPQRFRQLVRAYVILRDERQRMTYDTLLARANQQRALIPRRKSVPKIRNLVSDTIAGIVIAFVSIGAFLLFERVQGIPNVPAQVQQTIVQASALTAAMPTTRPSDTIGRAGERNSLDQMPVSDPPEAADVVKETTAPHAPAAADNTGTIPAISEVEVKDAGYYRRKGQLAYRNGDFALALVDFDLAINLDPNSSDTYIDRAIVFRRIGDLKNAFADITQAKRIDNLKPQQTTPPSGNN